MRFFIWLTAIFSAISLLYKWRYKVVNTLLAIGILRKGLVNVMMKIPKFRSVVIPSLFGGAKE